MRSPSTAHPADSDSLKAASQVTQARGKPPHALNAEKAYANPHAGGGQDLPRSQSPRVMRGRRPQGNGDHRRESHQGEGRRHEPGPPSEVGMEGQPLAHARGESMQAPTTHLSRNDPWRDPESPPTPETSRHVLERKKPRGAQGDPGKPREKDRRGGRRHKPAPATQTATDRAHGPAYPRETGTPSRERQRRHTGKTPPRHPDHA